jgi:hypothetical protein
MDGRHLRLRLRDRIRLTCRLIRPLRGTLLGGVRAASPGRLPILGAEPPKPPTVRAPSEPALVIFSFTSIRALRALVYRRKALRAFSVTEVRDQIAVFRRKSLRQVGSRKSREPSSEGSILHGVEPTLSYPARLAPYTALIGDISITVGARRSADLGRLRGFMSNRAAPATDTNRSKSMA